MSPKSIAGTSQVLSLGLALVCWIVIPVLVAFAVSQGPLRLFANRYLTIIVPALCLLAGLAVAHLRWKSARLFMATAMALAALVTLPSYYANAQVEDWRTPLSWLDSQARPGDGVVCYVSSDPTNCDTPTIMYYVRDGSLAPPFSGAMLTAVPDATDPAGMTAYAALHPRIFLIVDSSHGHAAPSAQMIVQWLDGHYRLIGQSPGSGKVIVFLYVTNTSAP